MTTRTKSSRAGPVRTILEPVALNLEIEFTNICNAACVACPRSNMPQQGLLVPETLEAILALHRPKNGQEGPAPRVTVAGGGEPLLNVQAEAMLETLAGSAFKTTLITNATAITPEKSRRIAGIGLDSICVSFWGVEREEYERAMKLPYGRTLEKVLLLRDALADSATDLAIIWVRTPEIKSDDEQVARFWAELGIAVDLDDTDAWNRGGLLPEGLHSGHGFLPDPDRNLWCADHFLSYSYDWQGRLLLCCCDYFSYCQTPLARAADGAEAIRKAKRDFASKRPLPSMCSACRLPRPQRARFLLGDAIDSLNEHEIQELTNFSAIGLDELGQRYGKS